MSQASICCNLIMYFSDRIAILEFLARLVSRDVLQSLSVRRSSVR